jgi:glycosyltransferase involved in cell wall biosynthesis
LRIAFLGARGVIGTYSGIETYYEEVGSRLAARGHRVTAYCRDYFTPDVPAHRGIVVRRLPCLRGKHTETLSHSLLGTFDCLFRDFDIVQYHAIGSSPLAVLPRLFGKKTVVSVRGLDWQRAKWGGFARRALQFGEWAAATFPSATAVVSKELERHYAAAHGKKVQCIPNAVMAAEQKPVGRLLEGWGLRGGDYLLFAGRISPEKGVDTLLAALKPLAPILRGRKLLIAGGGSFTDAYIAEMKALASADAIFLGRVGREEMAELYSNCLAFILPSAMEGLSVALLEAVSYGLPIVTTDIAENREVVGDAALFFPYGDAEALAARLRRLLEEPDCAAELREKSRARAAAQPGWDEVAELTEDFYLRILGRK